MVYSTKELRVLTFFFFLTFFFTFPLLTFVLIMAYVSSVEDARFDESTPEDHLSLPYIRMHDDFYRYPLRNDISSFIVFHDPKYKVYYTQEKFLSKKNCYLRKSARFGCFLGGHLYNYYEYIDHRGNFQFNLPPHEGSVSLIYKQIINKNIRFSEDNKKLNSLIPLQDKNVKSITKREFFEKKKKLYGFKWFGAIHYEDKVSDRFKVKWRLRYKAAEFYKRQM